MADVMYSNGQSFDFVNLLFTQRTSYFVDDETLAIGVANPLEGFDETAIIFLRGEGFVVSQGRVVSGQIEEITFERFRDQGNTPLGASLTIDELEVGAKALFDALSLTDPNQGVEAVVDLIFGGDDDIIGSSNDEVILAAEGDDEVFAVGGNDVIVAGPGADFIDGGSESSRPFGSVESIFSGTDNPVGDIVSYNTEETKLDIDLKRKTVIEANGDVDRLFSIEGASGGLGDDKLAGDDGDNYFITSLGSDKVDGRGGVDVVSYRLDVGVVADLAKGKAVEASGGVDKLKGVEGVFGSSGDDTIAGDNGDNILSGGFGGDDVLRGRGGDDSFVFSFNEGGTAVIKDFGKGDDMLVFDRSEFGIGAKFKLVVGDEPAVKGAASSFLFDVESGELRLDADGRGSGGAVLVATLDKVTSLTLDDFVLI